MAANPDLHAVLTVCGVTDVNMRNNIINAEGLNVITDLSILEEDDDVTSMAKRLSDRTVAEGRVRLGTVQIKKIQALIWWIKDRQKFGQPVNAADFDDATLQQAINSKRLEKEVTSVDVSMKDLGTFDPDDFDSYEEEFLNMLSQTYGSSKKVPLRYVVRPTVVPTTFANTWEEKLFQMPLAGTEYDHDNRMVYHKLKAFLINTPGWVWIETFNSTANGRDAFWAWSNHYNGQGELSKRTGLAKASLANLHYKNERSMSFERYVSLMTKAFTTLNKDEEERLSQTKQVEKLLNGIKTPDAELTAAKAVIISAGGFE